MRHSTVVAPLVLALVLGARAASADIISVYEFALAADRSTLHVNVGEIEGRIGFRFSLGVGEDGESISVVCREPASEWTDDQLSRLTRLLHDTTRITYSLQALVEELGLTFREFSVLYPRKPAL